MSCSGSPSTAMMSIRTEAHDLVALNDDRLVGQRLPRFHIEQLSSFDDDGFLGRGLAGGDYGTQQQSPSGVNPAIEFHTPPRRRR